MIRQEIRWPWRLVLGAISFVCLIVFYTWLSEKQHRANPEDRTLPSWDQLWQEGIGRVLAVDGTAKVIIWEDTKATFSRLFFGLFLAIALSLLVGLIMGCYAWAEAFFLPGLSFLAKIPATAMLAVFFVTVGTGETMFVTIIAFGVLPTLAQTVYHAAKDGVPEELLSKAQTLGASHLECVWDVICKHSLPKILEATRLQVGPALVYLIAAEWIMADVGFGYQLRLQSRLLDMSVVYVYLAFLGLMGLLLDRSLTWFQRRICPWYVR